MTRQEETRVLIGLYLAAMVGCMTQAVVRHWGEYNFLIALAGIVLLLFIYRWVVR